MNSENRWVKMADAIPWEIFEKKYSRLFKGKNGRVAKPLRLALGSLIIQTKYQYSDRELVDQLTLIGIDENIRIKEVAELVI